MWVGTFHLSPEDRNWSVREALCSVFLRIRDDGQSSENR